MSLPTKQESEQEIKELLANLPESLSNEEKVELLGGMLPVASFTAHGGVVAGIEALANLCAHLMVYYAAPALNPKENSHAE